MPGYHATFSRCSWLIALVLAHSQFRLEIIVCVWPDEDAWLLLMSKSEACVYALL